MGTWARRITNNIVVSHFDLFLFRIIGEQKRSMWLTSIRWIDLKLSIFTAWARNREYRSAWRSRTKCSSLWSRTIWWGSSTCRHFLLAVRWKKLQPPTPTADFAATVHRHVMPRLRLCTCVFVCEVERWLTAVLFQKHLEVSYLLQPCLEFTHVILDVFDLSSGKEKIPVKGQGSLIFQYKVWKPFILKTFISSILSKTAFSLFCTIIN